MVDLIDLCMLRILCEKNNDKALEFPVRAFSELSQANFLTVKDLIKQTEIDPETIQPIIKKLVKQKIFLHNHGKISVNKNLCAINKIMEECQWTKH